MTDGAFFLGYPIEFKNLCMVYPPKVKEVVSNLNYSIFNKLLTISQEEIEDEMIANKLDVQPLTPFEYLLNIAYNNQQMKQLVENAFLFFVREPILLMPEQKQIIIGDLTEIKKIEQLRILKEEDYFDFQNLVRRACGAEEVERPRENEDPRIKAIKAKARYRDKIKAKQGKGLKLESMITSICCMNLGINPLNIGELSYAAIPVLIRTYQNKEKYELDIKCLLAGADSKKIKPDYWIKNLD